MIDKMQLRNSFGYPFTTKKAVMEAMGYARTTEVRPYFYGLARIGNRYFTDDVITKIFENVKYDNSNDYFLEE